MNEVLIRYLRNVDGWKRGDEARVSLTDRVEKLVAGGVVRVVEDFSPEEPRRNASIRVWAAFLEAQGIEVHPQMTRRDLLDLWDGVNTRG